MDTRYLNITSKQVKDFFKERGILIRVSTVPSKKTHKLIQAWGQNTPEVRKAILETLYGSEVTEQTQARNYCYGNIGTQTIWLYQADWQKVFESNK